MRTSASGQSTGGDDTIDSVVREHILEVLAASGGALVLVGVVASYAAIVCLSAMGGLVVSLRRASSSVEEASE